jgi:tetratricopeptide (TPR) repeat protein
VAIDDLGQAIALNEDYVKAYIKRGDLYLGLDEYEEAIRDYTKAKTLDPCIL